MAYYQNIHKYIKKNTNSIKTKQSNTILHHVGKLLLQEQMNINYETCDGLKNSNLFRESFDLMKKRHIQTFDDLINKRGTQNTIRVADKKLGYQYIPLTLNPN